LQNWDALEPPSHNARSLVAARLIIQPPIHPNDLGLL
jgi:hypothetical protein